MLPLVLWGVTKRGSTAWVEGNSQALLRTFATCPVNPWGVSDNKHLQTKQSIKTFFTNICTFFTKGLEHLFLHPWAQRWPGHPPADKAQPSHPGSGLVFLCAGPLGCPIMLDPILTGGCWDADSRPHRAGMDPCLQIWDPLFLFVVIPDAALSVAALTFPGVGRDWQRPENSPSIVCPFSNKCGFFLCKGKKAKPKQNKSKKHKPSKQQKPLETWWQIFLQESYPGGRMVKNLLANAWDMYFIPGWGRSPEEGNGNRPQYSLPGEFHAQRSLVGYSSWGGKRVGHDSATKQQQVVCRIRERKDFPPTNPALTDVLTIVS